MDFGCGTGLLSFELMEPGAMSILGVDLAEGMIAKFNDKVAEGGLDGAMKAAAVDVQATAVTNELGKFDLIFSMLAFHHVPDPAGLVQDLAKHYLNPGGRLVVLDLEATENIRSFHPKHMELGVHYEHDGFSEATARGWFDPAQGWLADSVDVTRVPFDKQVDKEWDASEPIDEYNMMLVTAVVAGASS
jgi:SAM-dependent methyltransferase